MAEKTIVIIIEKQRRAGTVPAVVSQVRARQLKGEITELSKTFLAIDIAERDRVITHNARIDASVENLREKILAARERGVDGTPAQLHNLRTLPDKKLKMPDRLAMRQAYIDVQISPNRFSTATDLQQARAAENADHYIHNTLEAETHNITNQRALQDLGADPEQNTLFTATATVRKNPTYEDTIDLIGNDARREELQAYGHRPGQALLGSNSTADLFNQYKLSEGLPRLASLRVIRPGQERPLYSTNEFLLQGTNEPRNEKYQIQETFGEPIIFAFGEGQKIYTYAGTLLNTKNFQWKNKWERKYDDIMRASKTIEEGARVYLSYDDVIREGHILNTRIAQDVGSLNSVQFSFNMFITKSRFIGNLNELENDGDTLRRKVEEKEEQRASNGVRVLYSEEALRLSDAPALGSTVSIQSTENLPETIKTYVEAYMLSDDRTKIKNTRITFTAEDLIGRIDKGQLYDKFPNMPVGG